LKFIIEKDKKASGEQYLIKVQHIGQMKILTYQLKMTIIFIGGGILKMQLKFLIEIIV
jgi:hypothetical protein